MTNAAACAAGDPLLLFGVKASAFGEDRAVVTLVACSDGAGWGWLCASRRAR
jgi:hypothetical protein